MSKVEHTVHVHKDEPSAQELYCTKLAQRIQNTRDRLCVLEHLGDDEETLRKSHEMKVLLLKLLDEEFDLLTRDSL